MWIPILIMCAFAVYSVIVSLDMAKLKSSRALHRIEKESLRDSYLKGIYKAWGSYIAIAYLSLRMAGYYSRGIGDVKIVLFVCFLVIAAVVPLAAFKLSRKHYEYSDISFLYHGGGETEEEMYIIALGKKANGVGNTGVIILILALVFFLRAALGNQID